MTTLSNPTANYEGASGRRRWRSSAAAAACAAPSATTSLLPPIAQPPAAALSSAGGREPPPPPPLTSSPASNESKRAVRMESPAAESKLSSVAGAQQSSPSPPKWGGATSAAMVEALGLLRVSPPVLQHGGAVCDSAAGAAGAFCAVTRSCDSSTAGDVVGAWARTRARSSSASVLVTGSCGSAPAATAALTAARRARHVAASINRPRPGAFSGSLGILRRVGERGGTRECVRSE